MTGIPDPLPPDLLDELLSADLDGELGDAAAALGLDERAARARIDATPGAASRREALAQARQAIADVVLDDLDRKRLLRAVTVARSASPPARRAGAGSRWWVAAGVAAALLGVVGIVGAVVTAGGGDRDDATATGDRAEATAGIDVTPLPGDVSDPDTLRSLLRTPTEGSGDASVLDATGATGAMEAVPGGTGPQPPPAATQAAEAPAASSEQAAACAAAFQRDYGAVAEQTYTARHGDTPAVVVLGTLGSSRVAVVYDAATCALLEFQGQR